MPACDIIFGALATCTPRRRSRFHARQGAAGAARGLRSLGPSAAPKTRRCLAGWLPVPPASPPRLGRVGVHPRAEATNPPHSPASFRRAAWLFANQYTASANPPATEADTGPALTDIAPVSVNFAAVSVNPEVGFGNSRAVFGNLATVSGKIGAASGNPGVRFWKLVMNLVKPLAVSGKTERAWGVCVQESSLSFAF